MIAVYRCDEWRWLVGLTVELRQGGRTVRVGTVQHAMVDNSALWLTAEGVDRRMLVSAGEGYEIWLEPHIYDVFVARRTPQAAALYENFRRCGGYLLL